MDFSIIQNKKMKQFQVSFQYFRKLQQKPLIYFQQPSKINRLQPNFSHRQFSYANNSVILLLGFLYISQNLFIKNYQKLQLEILNEISEDVTNLNEIPQQFRKFCIDSTIQSILINGIRRIWKERKSTQNLNDIEENLAKIVNQYQIYAFCIVAWMRLRTIKFLRQNQKCYDGDTFGNQQLLLNNFQKNVRGSILEMICDCLKLKLIISLNNTKQIYGKKFGIEKKFITIQKGIIYQKCNKSQQFIDRLETAISENDTNSVKFIRQTSQNSQLFLSANFDSQNNASNICHRCRKVKSSNKFCLCRNRNLLSLFQNEQQKCRSNISKDNNSMKS